MKTAIFIALFVLLVTPFVVAAQNPCVSTDGAGGDIGQCVSKVYLWSLGISGLLAVAMAVFGGFLVMTARGNGQQASKGKSFIYSSLVGLILLMGAYILLNTINPDLTTLNTPDLNVLEAPRQ